MSSLSIAAGIVFFQDSAGLKRTLDSLKDFDSVIAIDGAFTAYNSIERLSTDGSRELCKKYPNVHLIDMPDCLQVDKRARYMEYAAEIGADHLLIIDSDEWIEGDISRFKANLPAEAGVFCVSYYNFENQQMPAARLISRPEKYTYHLAHGIMKEIGTDNIFKLRGVQSEVIEGIVMKSDDALHTTDYMRENDACQDRMRIYEAPIKERFSSL